MNLVKILGVGALGLLTVGGLTFWNATRSKKVPSKQETL